MPTYEPDMFDTSKRSLDKIARSMCHAELVHETCFVLSFVPIFFIPMFGAPVAYLFQYLLGIGQEKGTAGYTSLVIEPQAVHRFKWMEGSIETLNGRCAVSYRHETDGVHFTITVPEETQAIFRYKDREIELT